MDDPVHVDVEVVGFEIGGVGEGGVEGEGDGGVGCEGYAGFEDVGDYFGVFF